MPTYSVELQKHLNSLHVKRLFWRHSSHRTLALEEANKDTDDLVAWGTVHRLDDTSQAMVWMNAFKVKKSDGKDVRATVRNELSTKVKAHSGDLANDAADEAAEAGRAQQPVDMGMRK